MIMKCINITVRIILFSYEILNLSDKIQTEKVKINSSNKSAFVSDDWFVKEMFLISKRLRIYCVRITATNFYKHSTKALHFKE